MQHREIERAVYSGILEPSADWHSLTHEGSRDRDLRLTYRVRVQCEPNYYNATCTKFCRPRNDMFGHYDCDRNGDKTCMPGWTGATCETGHSRPHFNFFFLTTTFQLCLSSQVTNVEKTAAAFLHIAYLQLNPNATDSCFGVPAYAHFDNYLIQR